MKIIRNGQEIELTNEELWRAYIEQEQKNFIEDVEQCMLDFALDTTNASIDKKAIANNARTYLYDNDGYFEIYWDVIKHAIEDYIEEI